jgi:broad specificity phosphatase PhoE
MRAVLVRHGETDFNAKRIFQGYGDIPLSDLGHRQATRVAERLTEMHVDVFYSSDILRTMQTAETISQRLGMFPTPCEGLREWHVGIWEGKPVEAFEAHLEAIGVHVVSYVPEGGESQLQTQERMVAQMQSFAAQHAGETVLCVTHGRAIDMFARHVLGLDAMREPPYTITNTSVSIFDWRDDQWHMVTLNEIRHLETLR